MNKKIFFFWVIHVKLTHSLRYDISNPKSIAKPAGFTEVPPQTSFKEGKSIPTENTLNSKIAIGKGIITYLIFILKIGKVFC